MILSFVGLFFINVLFSGNKYYKLLTYDSSWRNETSLRYLTFIKHSLYENSPTYHPLAVVFWKTRSLDTVFAKVIQLN